MDEADAREQMRRIESSLQQVLKQKQHFSAQQSETRSALEQVRASEVAYSIVANIMIRKNPTVLAESLEEQAELFDARLEALEKQEKRLSEQLARIQERVLKEGDDHE